MQYNWTEIERDGGRYDFPHSEYSLTFPYDDGTPCYSSARASIKRVKKHVGYTHSYLVRQGLDPNEMTWQGEVGATNYMAESLSNGWDSFMRVKDDDFDAVYDELVAYLDELMGSGRVANEWVEENCWE